MSLVLSSKYSKFMEDFNKYISKSEIDSYVSKIDDGTFFDEFDTIKEDNFNPYNFNDNETLSIKVSSGLKNALKKKAKENHISTSEYARKVLTASLL